MRGLLEVADHPLTGHPPLLVLAAHGAGGDVLGQFDGPQHLQLLGPDLGRPEARRLLHRDQGEQLHQVVLQHVPRGTGGVVEAGAGADPDLLRHRDLYRVHVPRVPHRLEQRIGEPQRHDVLHGLLAEIVVDAEYIGRGKYIIDQFVELPSAGQVVAERLLHDHPAPPAGALVVGHSGALHLLEHHGKRGRRDGQVERGVVLDAVRVAQAVQRCGEVVECRVVVERPRDELDAPGQPSPHVVPPRRAGVRLRRLSRHRLELGVAPVAACESDHHEPGREQPTVGQVVDGGQQLLLGQVAGHPEDDQRARLRDPGQSPVQRVAKGVREHLRSGLPGRWRRRGAAPRRPGGRSGAATAEAGSGRSARPGRHRPGPPAAHRTCTAGPAPPGRP